MGICRPKFTTIEPIFASITDLMQIYPKYQQQSVKIISMDYKAKYRYEDYDSNYPALFEKEAEVINKTLVGKNYEMQHFGSTSIPNVGGKGIIDIYIATGKENFEEFTKLLEKIGYEMRESGGTEDRIFHHKVVTDENGKQQIFHVHVTHFGYEDYHRSLEFRDYLRSHPDLAKKYSDIKKKASEEALKYDDKDMMKKIYMEIKEPVIKEILQKLNK